MTSKSGYWSSLHDMATLLLIGLALHFIFVDHYAQILPHLPFLIILMCPWMHLFMYKSNGEHQ